MNAFYFESLQSNSSADFETFYQIYQQSIDPREQKPKAEISKLIERSDYRILLLKKTGTVMGFSIVYLNPDCKIGLLEYMAIIESARSRGLGGRLLKKAFESLKTEGDFRFGVIEVDTPDLNGPDSDIKQRRVSFYRRHGCFTIDQLQYILPLPGAGAPPKMNLMIYSVDPHDVISRKMLGKWLQTIYQKVYSCSPEDTRIFEMMNPMSDPIQIRKI